MWSDMGRVDVFEGSIYPVDLQFRDDTVWGKGRDGQSYH